MIRVYTTNAANAEALRQAASPKDYQVEVFAEIDRGALSTALNDISTIAFDLTCPEINADKVLAALDILDPERVPPILYILSDPSEVELITQSISMLNQDYSFVPIDSKALSRRLDLLLMLGARRKLTMESAILDRLTGLYNRKYFIRRLEEEMYRSKRYDYLIGVHLVEVDFASPGRELSEDAGTVVMKEIGEFFKGRLRKSDQIARFKWDSFAVLLPDISEEDSLLVARDIKVKVERLPIEADGLPIQTNINVGHIMLPAEGMDTASVVISSLEDAILIAKTEPSGVVQAGLAEPAQ